MSHEQLRHWAGKEYKPYDLLFGSNKTSYCLRTSSGAMGRLKKKRKNQVILIIEIIHMITFRG